MIAIFEYPLTAGGTLFVRPEHIVSFRELADDRVGLMLTTGLEYDIKANARELSDELALQLLDEFIDRVREIATVVVSTYQEATE